MSHRIRTVGIMLGALLVALFTLLPALGATANAATQNITIKDFEFVPQGIAINVGDTIVWKNEGPSAHTVATDDSTFDSGNLNAGAEFAFTFTTAGTFSYACDFHDSMEGTITVQAAPAPAADPAPAPAADPAPAPAADPAPAPAANPAPAPAADPAPAPAANPVPVAQPQAGDQPANLPRTGDEDASANLLLAVLALLLTGAALRLWLRRRDLTRDCL